MYIIKWYIYNLGMFNCSLLFVPGINIEAQICCSRHGAGYNIIIFFCVHFDFVHIYTFFCGLASHGNFINSQFINGSRSDV